MKLFAPEGSAEGCASGECLPEAPSATVAPPAVAKPEPAKVAPPAAPVVPKPEPAKVVPPPAPTVAPKAEPPKTPSLGVENDRWRAAVDSVREQSPRHGASLSHARFGGFGPDGQARIAFPPEAAFHRSTVLGTGRALVEEALTKSLGRPTKLLEDSSALALAQAPKSIAEEEASTRAVRENSIEGKVRSHQAIRAVERLLGGTLEHVAVLEPVKAPRSVEAPVPDEDV